MPLGRRDRESQGLPDPLRSKVWLLTLLLILAGVVSIATVAAVVIATNQLKSKGDLQPEVALPVLLVAGLIALVIALAILVGTFSIFGLSSGGNAFGVPEGTLQAVIAMMIIMIFAITSLYLNASLKETTFASTGISQQQLNAIPADEIRSIKARANAAGTTVYDIERAVDNPVGEDFAKQLLTTLSTLVVAIVGFYFGAKSVETGVAAASSAPVNSTPPLVTGEPKVHQTLTAEPGTWIGTPTPSYSYQWQRCTTDAGCSNIVGATERTYRVTEDDVGTMLRVCVTATSSAGAATVASATTRPVQE